MFISFLRGKRAAYIYIFIQTPLNSFRFVRLGRVKRCLLLNCVQESWTTVSRYSATLVKLQYCRLLFFFIVDVVDNVAALYKCSFYLLLTSWLFTDAVSAGIQRKIQNARLQEPFTLNCTYNCSSGFTRGYWTWENTPPCSKCQWKHAKSNLRDMCTVSLYTSYLVMEQTHYNYSCHVEESDRPGLPRKTELLVTLQVHGKRCLSLFLTLNNLYCKKK